MLDTSKKLQQFIGLYRRDQANLKDIVYMAVMNVLFISIMFGVLVYGSIFFICVNYKDLENTTNAVIVLMAGSSGVGCYCGMAFSLKSIQKLYVKLQNLANESNVIDKFGFHLLFLSNYLLIVQF